MNDLIQVIKVLDEHELKIVNSYVDELTFQENTVFDSNGKIRVDNSVRSSFGSSMNEEHQATKLLHDRINESLLVYKERVIPINSMFQYYPVPIGYSTTCYRESIQVLEYSPNQEYKFHHDTSNDPNSKEYHRIISIVLYLNDDFEGGGTEFPHKTYKPSPGYGLFFPSNWCFPHSGQKVLSGKKRVAVTWYYVNDTSA
jgi:Rps23 Pro-64 3,4-dihydroxylase Tpa1-like proline 4-hydroxylase